MIGRVVFLLIVAFNDQLQLSVCLSVCLSPTFHLHGITQEVDILHQGRVLIRDEAYNIVFILGSVSGYSRSKVIKT